MEEAFPDSVRFADGHVHPFEAIIFATGYTPGVDASSRDLRRLPMHAADQTGLVRRPALPVCTLLDSESTHGRTLREIALEAPRVARSIRDAVPFPPGRKHRGRSRATEACVSAAGSPAMWSPRLKCRR